MPKDYSRCSALCYRFYSLGSDPLHRRGLVFIVEGQRAELWLPRFPPPDLLTIVTAYIASAVIGLRSAWWLGLCWLVRIEVQICFYSPTCLVAITTLAARRSGKICWTNLRPVMPWFARWHVSQSYRAHIFYHYNLKWPSEDHDHLSKVRRKKNLSLVLSFHCFFPFEISFLCFIHAPKWELW